MRQSFRQSRGNAKVVAVAALAAAGIAAKLAWEMYNSGARDPSYIIFMALCAVIALAIVAPRRFSGRSDAEEQWGDEDEANRTFPETPMPADSDPSINRSKKAAKMGVRNSVWPSLSVNTDAPAAALRARRGPPVSLVR